MPDQKLVTSIQEFLEWTQSLSDPCLYRGLRKASWQVEAASFRRVNRNREVEIDYLEDLLKKARNRRFDRREGVKLHALEILADLQQNGAATCLMDFTRDSLVALWFACQSQESKEEIEDGKVVALSVFGNTKISEPTDEGAFLEGSTPKSKRGVMDAILTTNKLWVWEALRLNERITVQKSVFVFGGKEFNQEIPTAIISKDAKQNILRDLDKGFGISSESLFPDMSGFAQENAHDKPNPINVFSYLDQGFDNLIGGRFQEAVHAYTKALNMAPSDEIASIAYDQRGRIKAFFTMELLDAVKDFDEVVRIDPQSAGAFEVRGYAKLGLANYQDALADFEEAIRFGSESATLFIARGDAKKGLRDFDGAIADYTVAIEMTDGMITDFGAHRHRGNAKAEAGDFDGALDDFNKAIEIRPEDADAYYDRGKLRESLGDNEGADDDYAKASEHGFDRVGRINRLGDAKRGVGNLEGAIEDYSRAIKMDSRQVVSYVSRGLAKSELGDLQGALIDFDEAVWIDPTYGATYSRRGITKARLSDLEGAMADFESALKINPRDAHAYYVRAIVKNDTGDIQGAVYDIGMSISIAPDSPAAYAFRGTLRFKSGKVKKACADWRHALRLADRIGNTRVARDVSDYINEHCLSQ